MNGRTFSQNHRQRVKSHHHHHHHHLSVTHCLYRLSEYRLHHMQLHATIGRGGGGETHVVALSCIFVYCNVLNGNNPMDHSYRCRSDVGSEAGICAIMATAGRDFVVCIEAYTPEPRFRSPLP